MRGRWIFLSGVISLVCLHCGSDAPGSGDVVTTPSGPVDPPAGPTQDPPPKKTSPAPPPPPSSTNPPTDPSLDTGADDPSLADPNRPSAPYECQGSPVSAASIIDYIPQGASGFLVGGAVDGEIVLQLDEYDRQCTPATGCTAWSHSTLVGSSLYESYAHVAFRATPDGDVYVVSPLWDSHPNSGVALRKLLTADADVQLSVRRLVSGTESRDRVRIRATVSNGSLCISAATSFPSVAGADGATTEGFAVGTSFMPLGNRTPPVAFDESPYSCSGTPSTDAEIAAMFMPGQSFLSLSAASTASLQSSCHPLTGCSASRNVAGVDHFDAWSAGIVTSAAGGFATTFSEGGPSYAVKNGIFQVSATDQGSVRGACIDRRTSKTTTDSYGQVDETLDLVKYTKN